MKYKTDYRYIYFLLFVVIGAYFGSSFLRFIEISSSLEGFGIFCLFWIALLPLGLIGYIFGLVSDINNNKQETNEETSYCPKEVRLKYLLKQVSKNEKFKARCIVQNQYKSIDDKIEEIRLIIMSQEL